MLNKKISLGRISKFFYISLLLLLPLSTSLAHPAAADDGNQYHVVKTITSAKQNIPPSQTTPPAGQWCVDISWYDAMNNKYYLADNSNNQVDVVDAATNKLLNPIGKGDFTGIAGCKNFDFSQEGPEGILTDNLGQLWVGNGNSIVHVYNKDTGDPVATVNTGGTRRADELAYDAKDKLIIVTNPDEGLDGGKPFVTVIDAVTHKKVENGRIHVAGATSLEQPAWNPKDGLFYMSVPATTTLPGGEVAVIDPNNLPNAVIKTFPDGNCGPSGLAIDIAKQELALGCSTAAEIMDIKTGMIDTRISQITGVDEVWFNPGDERYYFGSFGIPALGVVNAATHNFITNVPSSDPGFHGAAVSSRNNEVFMPQKDKGIVVLKAGDTNLLQ